MTTGASGEVTSIGNAVPTLIARRGSETNGSQGPKDQPERCRGAARIAHAVAAAVTLAGPLHGLQQRKRAFGETQISVRIWCASGHKAGLSAPPEYSPPRAG
jgi:hypothetical protein